MKILEKINFRQPKYMLPAILYFPLLGASYFIFDLFQTETIEIQDKALQTTEFLNPELPGAQIKDDGIGSKYENMAKSWGKIQDYSAVDNIDREEPDKNKEEYESKYTQDDIDLLTEEQQEKAAAAEIASAKTREQEALAELEKALAEARLRGQNATVPPAETDTANIAPPQGATASGTINEESRAVKTPSADEPPSEVVRKVKTTSDYFNTLSKNVREPKLIQAIIDENIKAVDGSRVRLRLLVKVSLSLYDTDGMEGLYVPNSQFRETSKDVASGAMSGNMNMSMGSTGNSLAQWGMQAVNNAYQKTSNAISKAIKKNKVKLKYGTFVYLVNGQEKRK